MSCGVDFCLDGLGCGLNHAYDTDNENCIKTCDNDACWRPNDLKLDGHINDYEVFHFGIGCVQLFRVLVSH